MTKFASKINIARFLPISTKNQSRNVDLILKCELSPLRTVDKHYLLLKCELSRPRCLLRLGCILGLGGYDPQVSKEDVMLAHQTAWSTACLHVHRLACLSTGYFACVTGGLPGHQPENQPASLAPCPCKTSCKEEVEMMTTGLCRRTEFLVSHTVPATLPGSQRHERLQFPAHLQIPLAVKSWLSTRRSHGPYILVGGQP